MKKKLLAMIIAMAIILGSVPVANAASDTESLDDIMNSFMAENHLNEYNYSAAYYNTVTGESYAFNQNKLFTAASIYKLPLNMYYYEQEAAGNISRDAIFAGCRLSDCHYYSLQYSNNETSEAMQCGLGTYKQYKTAIAKYGGIPLGELEPLYFQRNVFSAQFMVNTLKYLYKNSDFFGEAITYLKAAQPNQYFKKYVSQYEIAQKYGQYNNNTNTVGIVYTSTPYLLAVLTQNLPNAEAVIGKLNLKLCDYTTRIRLSTYYSDVEMDAWYRGYVETATDMGLINGIGSNKFAPNTGLKLSEAIKLACIAYNQLNGENCQFVQGEPWYQVYSDYAIERQIVNEGDYTDLNRLATRAEIAYIFAHVLTDKEDSEASGVIIPDVDANGLYGKEIYVLYEAGVINGVDELGTFLPEVGITRAEAAAIMVRLMSQQT